MKKTNTFGLIFSILLFVIFIVLSIMFESTDYLYVASMLPLFIVLFLPDLKSSQYIKPAKQGNKVRLIKLQEKEPSPTDLFVISFEPGYVQWHRENLYFRLSDAVTHANLPPDPHTASMAVLQYDLKRHPRKKNWIGVSLKQIVPRTQQLSYTPNEINRLVIQMQDIHNVLQHTPYTTASTGSDIQA
jgi:hypothetical protein